MVGEGYLGLWAEGQELSAFFRKILSESSSTVILRGELAMDVKYVNRTGDKWFTDRAGTAPLMNRGAAKIVLEMLGDDLLLTSGGNFFNAFTEGLKLWNSEISTILESRNEI